MKKLIACAAVAAALVGITGCKSASTTTPGEYVGMTIHEIYTAIAEKQSAEFRAYVEALWVEIDKMEDATQIEGVYAKLTVIFDKICDAPSLNTKQKALIAVVRKAIDKAVINALKKEAKKHDKAVAWLAAVREGIRIMRDIHGADDAKLEELTLRLDAAFDPFKD